MSATIEVEQLQNEKARLEEEGRRLDEELQQLEKRWKLLNEKVIIQELKNKNTAKTESINQLKAKISRLETQLGKTFTSPKEEATATQTQNAENQQPEKETANAPEEQQEKDEDTIMITAVDSEEEISQNLAKQANRPLFY